MNLVLEGKELGELDEFCYLVLYISSGSFLSEEMYSVMCKTSVASARQLVTDQS